MTPKQLPPIADRTLNHIAESAGGKVEYLSTARLTIGRHILEAADNTHLLIQVLKLLKTL